MARRHEVELEGDVVVLLLDDQVFEFEGRDIPRRLVVADTAADGDKTTFVLYTRDRGDIYILPPPGEWDSPTEYEFRRQVFGSGLWLYRLPLEGGGLRDIVARYRPDVVQRWEVVEAAIAALDEE
jgi:hypothetical protein